MRDPPVGHTCLYPHGRLRENLSILLFCSYSLLSELLVEEDNILLVPLSSEEE